MPSTADWSLRLVCLTVLACVGQAGASAAVEPGPVVFNTNFEGASLGTIEQIGETTYRCHVRGQYDEHGRNRQASWYYFRMDGVRGRELTITMTDFVGEYNGRPGACPMGPQILPVWSTDAERWQRVPSMTWDDKAKEATIHLRPEADVIWIAHQPPYTPARLSRVLEELGRSDAIRVEVIGKTAGGRDLHLVTVTDFSVPDADKRAVWLQARQHAWESATSFVMEGAIRFVTSDDPRAQSLRKKVVFVFTPMVDPDGCASGQVRFNANGYDVNRHWNEVDLRSRRDVSRMPEIWYVKKAIYAIVDSGRKIDIAVNLHNTETNEYLQTLAGDDRSRAVIGKLSDRLVRETTFRPSRELGFSSGGDTSANVLYAEKGIPIMLMEQRIAKDPGTGRPPDPEMRLAFGANLIRMMAEVVLP